MNKTNNERHVELTNKLKEQQSSILFKAIIYELSNFIEQSNSNIQDLLFVTSKEFLKTPYENTIHNYFNYVSTLKTAEVINMINFLSLCKQN